jgi:hypothetical protein
MESGQRLYQQSNRSRRRKAKSARRQDSLVRCSLAVDLGRTPRRAKRQSRRRRARGPTSGAFCTNVKPHCTSFRMLSRRTSLWPSAVVRRTLVGRTSRHLELDVMLRDIEGGDQCPGALGILWKWIRKSWRPYASVFATKYNHGVALIRLALKELMGAGAITIARRGFQITAKLSVAGDARRVLTSENAIMCSVAVVMLFAGYIHWIDRRWRIATGTGLVASAAIATIKLYARPAGDRALRTIITA